MKVNPSYARLEETIANNSIISQTFFSGKINKDATVYKKSIYNFNISYDAVHKIGTQIGNSYTLTGSDQKCNIHVTIDCLYHGHKIDEFLIRHEKTLV